jgi:hypothetical protein
MSKIIYFFIFFIMLVSLLANPIPVTIELEDIILIVLPLILFSLTLYAIPHYKMNSVEVDLFAAILLYLSYLLISLLVGLLNGIGFLDVLRSVGPYINFIPILCVASFSDKINVTYMAVILIFIGILQACYLFFLYFTHSMAAQNTLNVLINRITLLDPHTTLPLILSVVILPLAYMTHQIKWIKFLAIGFFIFGLIAAAATLTRSLMIASLLGAMTFFVLNAYQNARIFKINFFYQLLKMIPKLFYFIPIYLILLTIPQVHHLEQGLVARFLNNSIAGSSSDYSNGRLFDEWLPALSKWVNNGFLGWFFGIGAGHTFAVTGGEERAYIHNLSIYSLVYGGFFGFFACMWLYFTIFKTLIIRARQTQQPIYLAFAALLVSIFTYGQFFAVHKGLSFNAMLYMIIVIALIRPINRLIERKI